MSKKKLLPKRMAGIKIPKKIRQGAVGDFLTSDQGQKMIAEGLLMVGAALLGRETASGSAVRKGAKAVAEGADRLTDATGDAMQDGPARVGQAFNAAMRTFREALQPEGEEWSRAEPLVEAGPAKKNSRPSSTDLGTAH